MKKRSIEVPEWLTWSAALKLAGSLALALLTYFARQSWEDARAEKASVKAQLETLTKDVATINGKLDVLLRR